MLTKDDWFLDVYNKFKLHFYKEVFSRFQGREATLTTTESYCADIIHCMGTPTIQEFADMAGISSPNATYKVNSLVKKGYLEKVQSTEDRRVFFLKTTSRYEEYMGIATNYVSQVIDRTRDHFTEEEINVFERVLKTVATKLTPEIDIPLQALGGKRVSEVDEDVLRLAETGK